MCGITWQVTMREKYPCSGLFWFIFFHIWTEYGEILPISPYSVQLQENTEENNCEYGHFLRSVTHNIDH